MYNLLIILFVTIFLIEAQENNNVSLFQNRASFQLAKDMNTMTEEIFVLKYPYLDETNSEAFSNDDATVCMVFTMLQNSVNDKMLDSIKIMMTNQINENTAANVFKSQFIEIRGKRIIQIQFVSRAVDTEVLNIAFATIFNGKLLSGSFSCIMDKATEWEPVGQRMIKSLVFN